MRSKPSFLREQQFQFQTTWIFRLNHRSTPRRLNTHPRGLSDYSLVKEQSNCDVPNNRTCCNLKRVRQLSIAFACNQRSATEVNVSVIWVANYIVRFRPVNVMSPDFSNPPKSRSKQANPRDNTPRNALERFDERMTTATCTAISRKTSDVVQPSQLWHRDQRRPRLEFDDVRDGNRNARSVKTTPGNR